MPLIQQRMAAKRGPRHPLRLILSQRIRLERQPIGKNKARANARALPLDAE
jgi:hypothetical protein